MAKEAFKKTTLIFYDTDEAIYNTILEASRLQRTSIQAYVMNVLEEHTKDMKLEAPKMSESEKPVIKINPFAGMWGDENV